jgi:hypothetical protein
MQFIIYMLFLGITLQASREECKVLMESISQSYEGKCRRGLAHGQGLATGIDRYEGMFSQGLPHGPGIYEWANGETYHGYWRRGVRHGPGVMVNQAGDTLAAGNWKNNVLKTRTGVNETPDYVVRFQKNITRLRFVRVSDGNKVFVKLDHGGGQRQISSLNTFGTSGTYLTRSNMFGYEEVTFPFEGRISFYGPSRTGYTIYLIELTYEINEPGNWEILLTY